jgi:probable rRNA maturation factor
MIEIDVIRPSARWNALGQATATVRTAATAAIRQAAPDLALSGALLTVMLADDARLRTLNADWRGKDKATNVLSFPASAPRGPAGGPRFLGDIALGFETVAREAEEQEKPLRHHAMHLVVHGVLHLLGYDHMKPGEAEAMEAMEVNVLAGLGIPDPYAGSEPETGVTRGTAAR